MEEEFSVTSGQRKNIFYAVSVVAALAALAIAIRFSGVDFATIEKFTARISLRKFCALMLFSAVFIFINAERWLFIYHASHAARDEKITRAFSLGAMGFSHVLVHFLPIQIAAVSARLLSLRFVGAQGWKSVVGTTVVEQAIDLALVLCAGVAFAVFMFFGHQPALFLAVFGLLAALAIAVCSFGTRPFAGVLSRLPAGTRWRGKLSSLGARLVSMPLVTPVIVFKVCLFSLLRLAAYAGLYYAVAVFMGLGVYAVYVPLVMPIVQLTNILPLTPGNIGILEGALLGLLLALGVPSDLAGSFALLARAIVFCANLCLLPLILLGLRLRRR